MFWNQLKTALLLASLSGLLMLLGYAIGGSHGVLIAFIWSTIINFLTYFFSDKLVLRMYGAQPLDRAQHSQIYSMVEELARNAHMPMPKLWYIKTDMANAFATGRNPNHASVAVTQGILDLLEPHELRGVLAHELSHVKNRDILIGTIAATIATAISYLATMIRWSAIFGGGRSNDRDRSGGLAGIIIAGIIAPLVAGLIQLAISRSREYLADESGAHTCHDPLALASALEKLQAKAKAQHLEAPSMAHASAASLFIVNPFFSKVTNLFSTHPPMEKRIDRLRQMASRHY